MFSYKRFLLLETKRIENLKQKYVNKLKISDDIFDYFNKHKDILETLLKIYSNTPKEKIEEIEKYGTKFHELLVLMLKKYMNHKDKIHSVENITQIKDIDQLRKILNEVVNYDDYMSKYKENDIWVLDNSYEYFIFKPYVFEASEEYGYRKDRNNWCTTYDETAFKIHFGKYGGLLYVINKYDPKKDYAFEINSIEHVKIWDYNNKNIKIEQGIENSIKSIWKPNEEPYVVLMKIIDKLKNDIPEISLNDLKKKAENIILNMSFSEFINNFGISIIFDYIDDKEFLNDVKEEFKYNKSWTQNIIYNFINFLYDNYLENDNTYVYNYFLKIIKNKGFEINDNDENIKLITNFIKNNYDEEDIEKIIYDLNLLDSFVDYLFENVYYYNDAKDYIENNYGPTYKIKTETLEELINKYVKWDELAAYIVRYMDDENLVELAF